MKVLNWIKARRDDESGAVTVDWVVLTAAIVVIGTGVISVLAPGLTTTSGYISSMVITAKNP